MIPMIRITPLLIALGGWLCTAPAQAQSIVFVDGSSSMKYPSGHLLTTSVTVPVSPGDGFSNSLAFSVSSGDQVVIVDFSGAEVGLEGGRFYLSGPSGGASLTLMLSSEGWFPGSVTFSVTSPDQLAIVDLAGSDNVGWENGRSYLLGPSGGVFTPMLVSSGGWFFGSTTSSVMSRDQLAIVSVTGAINDLGLVSGRSSLLGPGDGASFSPIVLSTSNGFSGSVTCLVTSSDQLAVVDFSGADTTVGNWEIPSVPAAVTKLARKEVSTMATV